jgi:hypothetical protein
MNTSFSNTRMTENLKTHGIRVMSYSGSMAMTPSGCRTTPYAQVFTDPAFFVALCAGNLGSRNPKDLCPGNIAGQTSNMIVVAAGRDGFIEGYSSRGDKYADIVADGQCMGSNGTSCSAPRVAGVAARIFEEFPHFSSSLMRQIILASAKLKYEKRGNERIVKPLDVRSGGELDFENASLLASCCRNLQPQKLTAKRLEQCLGYLGLEDEDDVEENKRLAKAKSDFLKSRGIVE